MESFSVNLFEIPAAMLPCSKRDVGFANRRPLISNLKKQSDLFG
jgi:hypothetical protein